MRSWLSDQVMWLGLMIRTKEQRWYYSEVVRLGRIAIKEKK